MAKEVKKETEQEVNVTVNEAQEAENQPEQKEQEKTWKQKRAEKKAQFEQEHPVAAKRIKVAKTVTLGAVAGFLAKTGVDMISNAISGKSSGYSGNSDVIDTTYTDVTNNDSNN